MLNKINEALPLRYKNLRLERLCDVYKEWYINNLKQDYFSEFLDTKYKPEAEDKVNFYIQSIIDKPINETNEIRMVLLEGCKPIGGCTVHKMKEDKGLEVAYFISPENQHKKYATNMLNMLIDKFKNEDYSSVYAIVQVNNVASIKLLQKLKFKEENRVQGPVCENIWFKLDIPKTRLQKYENIRLLHKGKSKKTKCIFREKLYNKIPIYTCDEYSNIHIIRFETDSVMVIINTNKYDTFKRYKDEKQRLLEIFVLYSLLSERYKDTQRIDVCLAYWFGFTQIIELIQTNKLGIHTLERVEDLENEIIDKSLAPEVPSLDNFLNSTNFVQVI